MNVASAIKLNGNIIDQIRIAVNAVSPRPMRLKAVEDAVRGQSANDATGEMAGKLAVEARFRCSSTATRFLDEELGEARDCRRGTAVVDRHAGRRTKRTGGDMPQLIQWATSPWGKSVPIHIAWV